MGDLRVSINEVVDASTHATNVADDIDGGLKSFGSEVDTFLSEWVGLSSTAFDESWLEWREGADRVLAGLRQSAALLAQTAQEYAAQEQANIESLQRASDGV